MRFVAFFIFLLALAEAFMTPSQKDFIPVWNYATGLFVDGGNSTCGDLKNGILSNTTGLAFREQTMKVEQNVNLHGTFGNYTGYSKDAYCYPLSVIVEQGIDFRNWTYTTASTLAELQTAFLPFISSFPLQGNFPVFYGESLTQKGCEVYIVNSQEGFPSMKRDALYLRGKQTRASMSGIYDIADYAAPINFFSIPIFYETSYISSATYANMQNSLYEVSKLKFVCSGSDFSLNLVGFVPYAMTFIVEFENCITELSLDTPSFYQVKQLYVSTDEAITPGVSQILNRLANLTYFSEPDQVNTIVVYNTGYNEHNYNTSLASTSFVTDFAHMNDFSALDVLVLNMLSDFVVQTSDFAEIHLDDATDKMIVSAFNVKGSLKTMNNKAHTIQHFELLGLEGNRAQITVDDFEFNLVPENATFKVSATGKLHTSFNDIPTEHAEIYGDVEHHFTEESGFKCPGDDYENAPHIRCTKTTGDSLSYCRCCPLDSPLSSVSNWITDKNAATTGGKWSGSAFDAPFDSTTETWYDDMDFFTANYTSDDFIISTYKEVYKRYKTICYTFDATLHITDSANFVVSNANVVSGVATITLIFDEATPDLNNVFSKLNNVMGTSNPTSYLYPLLIIDGVNVDPSYVQSYVFDPVKMNYPIVVKNIDLSDSTLGIYRQDPKSDRTFEQTFFYMADTQVNYNLFDYPTSKTYFLAMRNVTNAGQVFSKFLFHAHSLRALYLEYINTGVIDNNFFANVNNLRTFVSRNNTGVINFDNLYSYHSTTQLFPKLKNLVIQNCSSFMGELTIGETGDLNYLDISGSGVTALVDGNGQLCQTGTCIGDISQFTVSNGPCLCLT